MNVAEGVKEIVSQIGELPKEALTLDADLSGLGIDSLAALSIVASVEKKFGIRIPESELGKVRTIGDILEYAERPRKVKEKSEAPT